MDKRTGMTREEAFIAACKKNGLSYTKTSKKLSSVTLIDENGKPFKLKKDMTISEIKKSDNETASALSYGNELAIPGIIQADNLIACTLEKSCTALGTHSKINKIKQKILQ
jgi:hypothetical protein